MTEKFLLLMKTEERFVSGNRNNYLFSCGSYLKDNGLSRDEVHAALNWINDLYDSIPQRELQVLMRGLRI